MAVKDEIAAIHAGAGTLEEKHRAAGNLKAQRIADAISALPAQSRTYTRNGIMWTVSDFGATVVNGVTMLRLTAVAQTAPNGAILIAATDPLNPMHFVNPPILVPDGGTAPNPDHTTDPSAPTTRSTYKEDLIEALRQMLDSKLAEKRRA